MHRLPFGAKAEMGVGVTIALRFFFREAALHSRSSLLTFLYMVVLTAAQHAGAQDSYPYRPVRIVVPTAPGGPSDITSRILANELTKRWGRQVIVDIRPGAGTIIGTEIVAKAAPDGYTLLAAPGAIATNPASYKKLPYDALRDLATITQSYIVANLLVIHPSLPAKNVKEFIAIAKARPNDILYASAGHGTVPHLTMELFASMAGIRLVHVAYKGSGPGLVELMAGRVAANASSTVSLILPHIKAGKLRALGITTTTRSAAMPDIPTIAESGVPGYEAVQWGGMLAPAGTLAELISRLNKEFVSILRTPEVTERLAADNATVVAGTPEQFAAFMKSETAKWAKVARAAGIQPE